MLVAALREEVVAAPVPETGAMVRLLTCGSVDDGKSTLIGRLLWDATTIAEDQRDAVRHASQNRLVNGEKIDFSLLLDGLQAEREQGITIDIAWRYFETTHRRFVIIDAPGHEQYTRNMATGASHADVAILLIDARHGAKRQTRRHAAICNLVGIKKIVLAVNKMDLIDWSEQRFRAIEADFRAMAAGFGFTQVAAIPVAALPGDNVARPSSAMPWYSGPTLLDYLEAVDANVEPRDAPFRMPVQLVLRHADFRGYAGTVASGRIRPGDRIVDARSGLGASVRRIATMNGDLAFAAKGDAVAIELDTDLDISRGAVLSEIDAAADQCRRDRGALGLARRDALRSRDGLSAPHRDRSHPGDEHERFRPRQFRDLGLDAGACLRDERHCRLPHPARPVDAARSFR